jgi:hypothetical protein
MLRKPLQHPSGDFGSEGRGFESRRSPSLKFLQESRGPNGSPTLMSWRGSIGPYFEQWLPKFGNALVGLASTIGAKITAYTYAFLVNRMLGCPQGRIKELWA